MTKKHLEIVARIIDGLYFPNVEDQRKAREGVANQFATVLANYNPKFNREKFIEVATNNPAK
jgi:hypothetical protein